MRIPVCVLLPAVLWGLPVLAQDSSRTALQWHQWRGPTADGRAAPDARPPIRWDKDTNVRWTANLPGEGTATPAISGDRIFVLSAEATDRRAESAPQADERAKTKPPDQYYRFLVMCLDRNSGRPLWQQTATEQVPHEGHHETHTYAAGSPTTDGELLYASFGSQGIYCYSVTGELVWQKNLGRMRTRFGWGEAVTPVLAGDLLIVNWDQEENSFITALDKYSGTEVWKVERPKEVTSWNTPLVTDFNGRQLIVVNGTDRARAYDALTGSEIWSCGGQTTNAIPSPIRFEDTVICMSGYRGAAAFAIPLSAAGDITDLAKTRWHHAQGTPYVPSPALSGHRLFFTAGNSDVLTSLDVRTGTVLADRRRLSGLGSVYASPLVANGHLYFTGRQGTTVVLQDNDGLEVAAVNALDDAMDASPIAVGDQLFLRSWTKLYCIAAQSAE